MITTNAVRRRAHARATRPVHAQRPMPAHHHVLIALQAEKEGDATPDALIGFACPCGELFTPNGNASYLYKDVAAARGGQIRNRSHLRRVGAYMAIKKIIDEALAAFPAGHIEAAA